MEPPKQALTKREQRLPVPPFAGRAAQTDVAHGVPFTYCGQVLLAETALFVVSSVIGGHPLPDWPLQVRLVAVLRSSVCSFSPPDVLKLDVVAVLVLKVCVTVTPKLQLFTS